MEHLPKFWPYDPHLWLAQVNSPFIAAKISWNTEVPSHCFGPATLDCYRVTQLDFLSCIVQPICNLMSELLWCTSASDELQLQMILAEELGDCKPSQLQRHLQQRLRDKAAIYNHDLLCHAPPIQRSHGACVHLDYHCISSSSRPTHHGSHPNIGDDVHSATWHKGRKGATEASTDFQLNFIIVNSHIALAHVITT